MNISLRKVAIKASAFALCTFCILNQANADFSTVQLCAANHYVAKCGTVTIGTNILKGYSNDNISVPNYYDYSGKRNLDNLRTFFAGQKPFKYKQRIGSLQTVEPATYVPHRNNLLNAICNPINQSESFFTCSACPNGGKVAESTVILSSSGNSSDYSWNFHTFADCYTESFTDSSGTFKYIDDDSGADKQCYYANEIKGDALASDSLTENIILYDEEAAQTDLQHGGADL